MENTEQHEELDQLRFINFHNGIYGGNAESLKEFKYTCFSGKELFAYVSAFNKSISENAQKSKSEVKRLSAEEYWLKHNDFNTPLTAKQWCALMESFASMRVEEAKKEWKEDKDFNLEMSSIIATATTIEEARERCREAFLRRFKPLNNGN